ncbi:MAG: DUF1501 domain-containing protein [Planctomycetaceae bacterium]
MSTFSRCSRRDALRLAAGLGLSFSLPALDARAAAARGAERPKSLITLWMAGGPSQLETWDPHPEAKNGGPTQAIETRLTGLKIAHHFPQTAEQIQHLSVIRSLVSKEGDHERGTYFVQTGYRPDPTVVHPALGAILTRNLPDPVIEIPLHVALGEGNGFTIPRGGYLGDDYDAFRVFEPGRNINNLRGLSDNDRTARRLQGLDVLNRTFRRERAESVNNTLHEQVVKRALTMMDTDQLKAFSLDDEPAETTARYGDSRFGRGCLVARRLVETGVRAVQVTLPGFDTHAQNFTGHETQAKQLDPAFAALIFDLVERDLLDSTIVLCIGEFGRTPRINPLDGRDHWPSGFSCVIGGGGLLGGQVIGATGNPDEVGDAKSIKPADPVSVPDLYATILKVMGVDYAFEELTPVGRPLKRTDGSPLERLLG